MSGIDADDLISRINAGATDIGIAALLTAVTQKTRSASRRPRHHRSSPAAADTPFRYAAEEVVLGEQTLVHEM